MRRAAYAEDVTDYDPRIVGLYDVDNPDGPDHDFYRSLADECGARSVLDLGCGTGMLTVTLARDGRRVVGVDPSRAMLEFARRRDGGDDVEWVLGDSRMAPSGPFDLVLMTGNVVQHLPDAEWARTLHDLRARMRPGGTLSFESRNPAFREWESWSAAPSHRETPHGTLTEWMDVEVVDERIVRFRAHNRFATGETVIEEQALVFRSQAELEDDLQSTGFGVESVHGEWTGAPFDGSTRLMIFTARAL
ncbi:class I SAM-dependent methyltransferase [Microbacterium oleivorans]|uniref:class I SAM-dependent methyltransferase n=1 Tax=Microbacterium oleivorans TaxID=273677 RepID=UPI0027E268BA|nr:class I SAM-dependent methyltransferase [Microbacterium oleivorans]